MRKHTRYLAVLAVLALLLGACSDSDDDGGSVFAEAADSPADDSSADDSTPFERDDSSDDDSSPFDDVEIPTDVGDLPGVSDECEDLLNIFLSIGGVFLGQTGNYDPDAINRLPGEIQDDARILVGALQAFSEGLEDLGVDLSDPTQLASLTQEQQNQFAELSEQFDSEEFNRASDNLSNYGEQECDEFIG